MIKKDEFDMAELAGVPNAVSSGWFKCNSCDHLHVILRDEYGVIFAAGVFDKEMISDMWVIINQNQKEN